jgi:hypothetical protein
MKLWDRTVLDNFVEHGLVEEAVSSNDGKVTSIVRLKTRPFDEAAVYCEWSMCYEVWGALTGIDPRLHLHWIMSGKSSLTSVVKLLLLSLSLVLDFFDAELGGTL